MVLGRCLGVFGEFFAGLVLWGLQVSFIATDLKVRSCGARDRQEGIALVVNLYDVYS